MNLVQLNAFIHTARVGNISQAAKELGLPQPTLSRHISQLEQMLGQTLINRQHRPMILTPAGQFFYERAQKSVSELSELITLTQNFGKLELNTLNIGFVASILYGLLPEVIRKLKTTLPNLNIHLIEVSSNEQPQALKSGIIDVGFGRFLSSDVFIKQIFLRHEHFVVALPHHHKLAKNSALAFSELIDETLILYHRTPLTFGINQTLDPLLQLFYERDLTPKHTQKASDIQIALGLVSAGEGLTVVPKSLTSVRAEQIAYIPLTPNNATSSIYLNTLSTNQNPNIAALLDAIYAIYQTNNIPYADNQ